MSPVSLGNGSGPFAPATVDVDLLQGFEARCSGHVIDLPHAGERLLAFLALQDRPVQRGYVAGVLWIDASEEHAHAALRTTLWRIRQRTRDVVTSTGAGLALARHVSVDLRRAGDCARRALRRRGVPQIEDMAVLCDAGELLPDWYDDWLAIERERFRQLRLLALDALCEDLSAKHRYEEAVIAGLASVAAEPLRESAHRGLIRAHLAAGNPCEALREYRLFQVLLRDQLGLEPSPELRALVAAFER
jgi:DNA-binding SARP family transcriptional activator